MKLHIAFLLILTLTGCLPKFDRSSLNFTSRLPGTRAVEAETKTLQTVMNTQCIGCHAKVFEDPARLDRWMTGLTPEESKIFMAVESGKMPKGKPALPTSDLELIRAHVSNYQVFEKILTPNCVHCHEKTLTNPERMAKWIVPGLPEESRLYLAVKSGSMPKGKERLSETQLKVLENYILQLR